MATESVATSKTKPERKVLRPISCLPDNRGDEGTPGKHLLEVRADANAAAALEMGMCLVSTAHRLAESAEGTQIGANEGAAIVYLLDIAYALLAAGAGENGEIVEAAA